MLLVGEGRPILNSVNFVYLGFYYILMKYTRYPSSRPMVHFFGLAVNPAFQTEFNYFLPTHSSCTAGGGSCRYFAAFLLGSGGPLPTHVVIG